MLLSWGHLVRSRENFVDWPGGSDRKASACNAGDLVWSLGQEDLLEKEMAPHSSTLAWKIPWMEEPGGLQFMGPQRVGHNWATSVTHSERTSATPAWGGGCYRSLVSRDQGCLLLSVLQCTGPPSPPPTKNYLVQSSVVLKNWVTKPCSIVSLLALKSTLSDINWINIHVGSFFFFLPEEFYYSFWCSYSRD